MALEQSEPLGHGHYPFYLKASNRILLFIIPNDPSHHKKQGVRHFCQRVHPCKQQKAWQLSWWWSIVAQPFRITEQTVDHNTLQVQLVLQGILLLASLLHSWQKRWGWDQPWSMNLASSLCGGDGKWDRQEVLECPDGDDNDTEEDKKSSSEANKQKEGWYCAIGKKHSSC